MQKDALLLHNIRSAHNVGSMFRTADGAGLGEVLISGYTPRPRDRFGRPQKDIAKTALGAERTLAWREAKTPAAFLAEFRARGYEIVGVEQDPRAIDFKTFKPMRPVLYVLGNEVRGLSPALRRACDVLIEIPMHGKKESLNVSVAAGIVLFTAR